MVGARRVRQGTGGFLAQHCHSLEHEVVAVVGTTEKSAAEASKELKEHGIKAKSYSDVNVMLKSEKPDALIIASPAGRHGPALIAGLEAKVHVLCEKPMLASSAESDEDDGAAALAFVNAFAERGLVFAEACQWPLTLSSFRSLYPDVELTAVEHVSMRMAPPVAGREMLVECLSHPLSLAQALAPGEPELCDVSFEKWTALAPGGTRVIAKLEVAGRYLTVELLAADTGEYPRPAEYSLDGHLCRRRVHEPGYRITFDNGLPADDDSYEQIDGEDPMRAKVGAFLEAVQGAETARRRPRKPDDSLSHRQALFSRILAAHDRR